MEQSSVQMSDRATIAKRSGTRVAAVMAHVQQRIAARNLAPGAKLASIRALAGTLKVSNSTVVEAYERLAAEGVNPAPVAAPAFIVAGQLAPLALSRSAHGLTAPSIRSGCRASLWKPATTCSSQVVDGFRRRGCRKRDCVGRLRALRAPEDAALADYGTPLGLPALRQLLTRRLGERGIEASPEQIMLTESGTQAIDLLCRFLIEPGDTVLVDDPCYFNFHALLRAHRAKVVGVPLHTVGTGHRRVRKGAGRAPTAPLHHQFRDPQSDRRDLVPRRRPQVLKLADQVELDHRRGRHIRRFRAHAGATSCGLRWPRPRRPYRQFLQDAFGIRPVRFHRYPTGLDRRADRPQDRDIVRRRAACRRTGIERIERRQLSEAHGETARATVPRHDRRRRKV